MIITLIYNTTYSDINNTFMYRYTCTYIIKMSQNFKPATQTLPFSGVRGSRLCKNKWFVGTGQEQAEIQNPRISIK